MVETILSAVDEYQSAASGADISYKMSAKAKNGGTLGRATARLPQSTGHLRRTQHRDRGVR